MTAEQEAAMMMSGQEFAYLMSILYAAVIIFAVVLVLDRGWTDTALRVIRGGVAWLRRFVHRLVYRPRHRKSHSNLYTEDYKRYFGPARLEQVIYHKSVRCGRARILVGEPPEGRHKR